MFTVQVSSTNTIRLPYALAKTLSLEYGGTLEAVYINGQAVLKPKFSFSNRVNYAWKVLNTVNERVVSFAVCGRSTICTINRRNHAPMVGISHCDPNDEFNPAIGRAIAFLRATGKPVPPILIG